MFVLLVVDMVLRQSFDNVLEQFGGAACHQCSSSGNNRSDCVARMQQCDALRFQQCGNFDDSGFDRFVPPHFLES